MDFWELHLWSRQAKLSNEDDDDGGGDGNDKKHLFTFSSGNLGRESD